LFIATGLRLSELLGELWTDFDEDTGTISITGKIVRVKGQGPGAHRGQFSVIFDE
jgi:integrase